MPGKTKSKGNGVKGRPPAEWIKFLKSKGAPQKLIDQIRGIEESGRKYDKSKEYIIRTIIDKIPQKYLEEPTKVHGPGKSGPLAEKKKKSFELEPDDFFDIEQRVKKIAKENNIENVEEVTFNLTANEGIVRFKISGKEKGPGIPDGTGPYSDTPECQLSKKKQEKSQLPKAKAFGLNGNIQRKS